MYAYVTHLPLSHVTLVHKKVVDTIGNLACLVQDMSSNPNYKRIQQFMTKYASSTRNVEHHRILKALLFELNGDVNADVEIYPEWFLVEDAYGNPVDALPYKPIDPFDTWLKQTKRMTV